MTGLYIMVVAAWIILFLVWWQVSRVHQTVVNLEFHLIVIRTQLEQANAHLRSSMDRQTAEDSTHH